MDFRVLGPLSVRADGEELVHVTGKPRQVLALLLLNEPHRVPASSLTTELWDDEPPRSATTTLYSHVCHLRRELARRLEVDQVARDLLQTRGGGYRVNVGEAAFDLREFHRLRSLAQARLNAADAAGASRVLGEALALWRGPALADVDHGRLLRAAVAELDRSRLDTLALFFRTQLDMGRHREVVSALARLAVRHPHHEELHAQLMIALYRSGYRVRALQVFNELRRTMHDQLGTSPAARTVRLWHAIRTAGAAAANITGR